MSLLLKNNYLLYALASVGWHRRHEPLSVEPGMLDYARNLKKKKRNKHHGKKRS